MNWLRQACVIAAVGMLAAPVAVSAQDYPNKPIRLIVVTAPGGLMDVAARITAEQVGKALGQTIVIENRPGGGGNLGAEAVAKAAPDGYTLGLIQLGNVAINPHVYKDLTFDPLNDLAPVAPVTSSAILVIAGNNVADDLRGLIALAKQQPGKLNYGSGGRRHGAASGRGDVCGCGRHQDRACALSRRGTGGERSDRRPYPADLRRLGRGPRRGRSQPRQGSGGGAAAATESGPAYSDVRRGRPAGL
jgi:hypothetical protein